jgi:hypothetical protein
MPQNASLAGDCATHFKHIISCDNNLLLEDAKETYSFSHQLTSCSSSLIDLRISHLLVYKNI